MMTPDARKRVKESLVYTLVFYLGYLAACSSGTNLGGRTNNPASAILWMLSSSDHRGAAILPNNTGNQAVVASGVLGGQFSPLATISNPSQLAQTYDSHCDGFTSNSQSIHQAYGNTGLAQIPPVGGFGFCNLPSVTSIGFGENGHPTGFPVILPGTINNLVVYGTFVSGNFFRCLDTTNTTQLADASFVRAYYDLAHDAVILGSGTTQLTLTCSISIPGGDDIQHITVQWLKS
jgi:hypothetical protein